MGWASGSGPDGLAASGSLPPIAASGGSLVVPDAQLLFTADYTRVGDDLLLTGADGATLVIADYFALDAAPILFSPDGAMISPELVGTLVASQTPRQFAQAGEIDTAPPIGEVQDVTGTAAVIRDGVPVELSIGDPVFQNDVVQTGLASGLVIGFADDTIFTLASNARITLDGMIYDPAGADNSLVFSVVQGAFSFVTGQIAPTGEMLVKTPVGTIGIRGTIGLGKLESALGPLSFMASRTEGGPTTDVTFEDPLTGAAIGEVFNNNSVYQIARIGDPVFERPATVQELFEFQSQSNALRGTQADFQFSFQPDQPIFQPDGGLNQRGDAGDTGNNDGLLDTASGPSPLETAAGVTPGQIQSGGIGFDRQSTGGVGGLDPTVAGSDTQVTQTTSPPPAPSTGPVAFTPQSLQSVPSGPLPPTGADFPLAPDATPATPTSLPFIPPLNTNPVVASAAATPLEDAPQTTPLGLTAPSDADGDPLTISVVSLPDPAKGAVTLASGTPVLLGQTLTAAELTGLQFNAAPNAEGPAGQFVYAVSDGIATVQGAVTIAIAPVNDPPSDLLLDVATVAEDTAPGTAFATVSAVDPDLNDPKTFSLVNDAGGRFVIDAQTGEVSVKAALDFETNISHVIRVLATDSGGLSVERDFTITVGDVDDEPPSVLNLTNDVVAEDAALGSVVGTVSAVDPDSASHTFSLISNPGGLFAIDPQTGALTLAAALDFEAAETHQVIVRATDPGGNFLDTPFTINVTDVNEPPVAQPDAIATDEDNLVAGNVLLDNGSGADSDPENDILTVTAVNGVAANVGTQIALASGALLTLNSFGTFDYDPNGRFEDLGVGQSRADSFTYTVDDGNGGTDTATATVTVTGVNDPPEVDSQQRTVDEDSLDNALGLSAPSDVDGDTLIIAVVTLPDPDKGTVTLAGGAAVTLGQVLTAAQLTGLEFDTLANATGAAGQFEYSVFDGTVTVNGAVTLSIGTLNDPPILGANELILDEGETVVLSSANLSATDVDNPDPDLIFAVAGVTGGQFELVANPGSAITRFTQGQVTAGAVQFVHDGGEAPPAYTVTVSDGVNTTTPDAATIDFTNLNDPPVLGTNTLTLDEGGTVVLASANLSAADVDNPDPALTFTVAGVTGGQFEFVANSGVAITQFTQGDVTSSAVQFVHDGGEAPPAYTVTVSDGVLITTPDAATIDFTNLNDPPVVDSQQRTVDEDSLDNALGLSAPGDADGDALTITVMALPDPDKGTVILANGVAVTVGQALTPAELSGLQYDTVSDAEGLAGQFVYAVFDGTVTVEGTIDLDIAPVNDAPVLGANLLRLEEGETVVLSGANLSATDVDNSDPDLIFEVAGVTGGQFEFVADPGVAIAQFTQGQVTARAVQFVHNGEEARPSYTVTVSDGTPTAPRTAEVVFTNLNDAPVVDLNGDAPDINVQTGFTEGGGAVVVAPLSVVIDPDSGTLASLTVTLIGPPDGVAEVLSATASGSVTITGLGTGSLTLSGGASLAEYQAVLRTVTYNNTSTTPTIGARTIEVQGDDGAGLNNLSQIATATINVSVPVTDLTWTNASGDGFWDTAANWSEGRAPVDGDNVTIPTGLGQVTHRLASGVTNLDSLTVDGALQLVGGEINVTGTVTFTDISAFTFSSGVFGGTEDIVLNGNFVWVAGHFSGLRTVTINGTASVFGPGVATLIDTDLVISSLGEATLQDAVIDATLSGSGSVDNQGVLIVVGSSAILGGLLNADTIELTTTVFGQLTELVVASGQLVNTGTINSVLGAGGVARKLVGEIVNQGSINVDASLAVDNAGTTFNNEGVVDISASQTLRINGGTFDNLDTGVIQGSGRLDVSTATFNNAGALNPGTSAGAFAVVGDYTQESTGSLNIELGGTADGDFDVFTVTGTATLGGTLDITLIGGFVPAAGQSFDVISAGTFAGTFDAVNIPNLGGLTVEVDGDLTDGVLTLSVVDINDAPVIGPITPDGAVFTEGDSVGAFVDADLTVTDVDSANLTEATVDIVGGPGNAGLEFLDVDVGTTGLAKSYDANTGVLTLTGTATLAQYEQVLRTVTYFNNADDPTLGDTQTQRSIRYTVNDGLLSSAAAVALVDLTAVNDAPVNTVPGAQSKALATDLVFSDANGNALSIADADAGGADVRVTLAVGNGMLSLVQPGALLDLDFDPATIVVEGPLAEINLALAAGVTYSSNSGFVGTDTLSIVTNDLGNTGSPGALSSPTDTIAITVSNQTGDVILQGLNLIVGDTGTGTFSLSGGESLLLSTAIVGNTASGIGTLEVTGVGTALNITAGTSLTVGAAGTGTMTINSGATTTVGLQNSNAVMIIGEQAAGVGTVTVNAATLSVNGTGGLTVGNLGTGTLRIENGALTAVTSDGGNNVDLGRALSGDGTVVVTGAGSTLRTIGTDNTVRVGALGTGNFAAEAGATVETLDFRVGDGGTGSAALTGLGTTLVVSSEGGRFNTASGFDFLAGIVTVGGDGGVGGAGVGTLNVLDQAKIEIHPGLTNNTDTSGPGMQIGEDAGSRGAVLVDGTGSLIDISQTSPLISFGPFLQVGDSGVGSLTIQNEGRVALTGNDSFVAVSFRTGSTGLLDINSGGKLAVDGDGDAAFITIGSQANTNGRVVVDGSNDPVGARSEILLSSGPTGAQASFLSVGLRGTGSLDILGGARVRIDGETGLFPGIEIGGDQSTGIFAGDGAVRVSGTDSELSIAGNGGIIQVGDGGAGTLLVTDNALATALQLDVGRSGTAITTISNGGRVVISNDEGTFDPNGNFVNEAGFVRVGRFAGSDGTLNVLSGGVLEIREGQGVNTDTFGPALYINRDAGSTGAVLVSGARSQINITQSTPAGNDPNVDPGPTLRTGQFGGDSSLTIEQAGQVNLAGESAQVFVGAGGGTHSVTIRSGGTLNIDGTTGSGRLVIGDGQGAVGDIKVTGPGAAITLAGNADSALVVGSQGQGTLTIEDGGAVTVNGAFSSIAGGGGSTGTVTVRGPQASFTVNGGLTVGVGTFGTDGVPTTGTLELFGGGTASVAGNLTVAANDIDVTGSVLVSGMSTLEVVGNLQIGGANFGAGQVTILSGGHVEKFGGFGIGANATMTAGSGSVGLGSSGALSLNNGGVLNLGEAPGTFEIQGDYVQNFGGTLNLKLGLGGANVVVNGTATFAQGATVRLEQQAGVRFGDAIALTAASALGITINDVIVETAPGFGVFPQVGVTTAGFTTIVDRFGQITDANVADITQGNGAISVNNQTVLVLDDIDNTGAAFPLVNVVSTPGQVSRAAFNAEVRTGQITVDGEGTSQATFNQQTFADGLTVGPAAAGTSLAVVGSPGSLNLSNFATVGNTGAGLAELFVHGSMSVPGLFIGNKAGAQGRVTVDGGDVAVTSMIVGIEGNGELILARGGTATVASGVTIGNAAGSTGTVTVRDDGSKLAVAQNISVADGFFDTNTGFGTPGAATSGALNVLDGGVVEAGGDVFIAPRADTAGTVNVSGAGSRLVSTTPADQFAQIRVGTDFGGTGGTGTLNVGAGGEVRFQRLLIGDGAGSTGTVTVSGAGARLITFGEQVGGDTNTIRFGAGDGTLTVSNGGFLSAGVVSVTGTGVDRLVVTGLGSIVRLSGDEGFSFGDPREGGFLRSGGQDGESGAIEVNDGGKIFITSSPTQFGPALQIARNDGSTGEVTIDGAGTAPGETFIEISTTNLVTDPDSFGPILVIHNGAGTVNIINGGELRVIGDDAAAVISNNRFDIPAQLPLSTVTISTGGKLIVDSGTNPNGAEIVIGQKVNSNGKIVVDGTNDTATMRSEILLSGGAAGQQAAFFNVGSNGTGTLDVLGGARLLIDGKTGVFPGMTIGGTSMRAGGTGAVTVSGTGSEIGIVGDTGVLQVGRNGAGVLNVEEGGSVSGATFSTVGWSSVSTGTLIVTGLGSLFSLTGTASAAAAAVDPLTTAGQGAFLTVGREGTGRVEVTNGASITIDGLAGDFAGFQVGRNAGSDGTIVVDGANSNITVLTTTTGSDSGYVAIGRSGTGRLEITDGASVTAAPKGVFFIGGDALTTPGTGTVLVQGTSTNVSTLNAGAFLLVGMDFDYTANTPLGAGTGGTGTLTIGEFGTVNADQIFVGTGGTLGGTGNLNAATVTIDGGTVAAGFSAGTLGITGDFVLRDGVMDMELGGTVLGQSDLIDIGGAAQVLGGRFDFQMIDGYVAQAGDEIVILNAAGGLSANAQDVSLAFSGVTADFQFEVSFGADAVTFTALNDATPGNSTIFWGGDLDDVFHGGSGDDLIFGGGGADILFGNAGADTLTGGAGADTFALGVGDGGASIDLADVITDFEDGVDLIGLTGGLGFAELSRTDNGAGGTVVSVAAEILVVVDGIAPNLLDETDFTIV